MAPKLYSAEWFRHRSAAARRSAEAILPLLFELSRPRRVIDLGCGTGSWLAVAREMGAEVVGVDGDYVARSQLEIPEESFVAHDLTQPLQLDEAFDLALCLEVAEHLPAATSAQIVETLVGLAPVVAFSAAVPGQDGTGHVNTQWQDEWAARFCSHGYEVLDLVRPRVWDHPDVRYFYAQNLLVYVDPQRVEVPELRALPLRVVHPRLYESARRALPAPREGLDHVRQAVRGRLSGIVGRARRA